MKFRVKRTSGKWIGYQKDEITLEIKTLEDLIDVLHHFGQDLILTKRSLYLNQGKLEVLGEDRDVKYLLEVYDGYRE